MYKNGTTWRIYNKSLDFGDPLHFGQRCVSNQPRQVNGWCNTKPGSHYDEQK